VPPAGPMPFSTSGPIPSTVPAHLLKYRTCSVCRRPTVSPWSPYCARCRGHLHDRPENAKRREALVAAYDPGLDGFRCSYSGAPLEEVDQADPFYLYSRPWGPPYWTAPPSPLLAPLLPMVTRPTSLP